ncbi:MAG TPA: hypothetical protein PLF78_10550 [Caulobacter sp.]|nr:hypothetical protein [Caulobacter sp.]
MAIQIDAFDVQLGAALLLQFTAATGTPIRVLADAGAPLKDRRRYPFSKVAEQLDEAFAAFGSGDRRIDLMIGTHYDADHLTGLTPIVEDLGFEIGQAWLPPVVNDVSAAPADGPVRSSEFFALQLAGPQGKAVLRSYLDQKARVCVALARLERGADDFSGLLRSGLKGLQLDESVGAKIRLSPGFFERHRRDAWETLGGPPDHDHGRELESDPGPAEDELYPYWLYRGEHGGRLRKAWATSDGSLRALAEVVEARREELPGQVVPDARALAAVRASEASKAINAKALAGLVAALKRREVPIRCEFINDGAPSRFVWQASSRAFVAGQTLSSDGPVLKLLGPSRQLIDKHRNLLPIGDYMAKVAFTRIRVQGVTESNQLSYVLAVEAESQRLLVSGDTGFNDFRRLNSRDPYYPSLLQALKPLHVIQVAHHGGHNGHFYNVLLSAGFAAQTEPSFLLLSHETDDRTRPSIEFGQFIAEVRKDGDDMTLLFTARPSAEKVLDYRTLIAPASPPGGADRGDVRLRFDRGWSVVRHPVGF